MTREDYESRKRVVEAQLAADIELLRAAAQLRLHALEELWRAHCASEEDAGSGTPASAVTQTGPPDPPAEPPAKPDQAAPKGRIADVLDVFPRLPEVFDKMDVARLLGYEPSRQTLNRAWSELDRLGKIKLELLSEGRRPTKYRKVVRE